MILRIPTAFAFLLCLAAAPAVLHADLWPQKRELATARRDADYRRHMALGDHFAIEAAEVKEQRLSGQPRPPRAYATLVERATQAYERAAALRPDAAEPHYRAAEVIYAHLLDNSPRNTPVVRDREVAEQALAHWRAFEERAPLDPRTTLILFRRAILNTKMADDAHWKLAIEDYQTLIRRSDLNALSPGDAATWLGNLAETYMMTGRLDEAIDTYKRALDFSNQPLYGYGLAVAYDRDGQGQMARETMLSYAHGDRLRSLGRDGIFFVPEGERHYYLALGYEALGELHKARTQYQHFVNSGAHPRFQSRAHQHLRQLDALLFTRSTKSRRGHMPRIPEGLGL